MYFEIIETNRLKLKGLYPQDFTYLFEHFSIPEIMKVLGHRSEDEYLKEEAKFKNGYASYNRSFILFLMTNKETGTIIGRCGLHNWNVDHRRAEIGYVMEDEHFKRKGLMTEAVEAVIDFGFNTMNLHRIEALVGKENIASLRIIEKFKFTQEGILREHFYTGGKFEDSVVFSRLRVEYFPDEGPKHGAL